MSLKSVVLVCLIVTGCGGGGGTEKVIPLSDSPAHVFRQQLVADAPQVVLPERPRYEGPLFEVTLDRVFGGDEEGPGWQLFTGPPMLLVYPDGRMIMADSRRGEFVLVSAKGDLIRRFGRTGAGPGEFDRVSKIWWREPGVEFWVFDRNMSRISRYEADADLVGTLNVSEVLGQWLYLEGTGRGGIIARGHQVFGAGPRQQAQLAVLDDSFRTVLDLGLQPYQLLLTIEGRRFATMPYGGYAFLDPFPDGGWLLSYSETGNLVRLDAEGRPLMRITGVGSRRPFSAEERRWFRSVHADRPTQVKDADNYLPDALPAFGGVRVDDSGIIWISHFRTNREQLERERLPVYDFITAQGDWLGRQEMPVSFSFVQGGFGYHVPILPDDVPRVERWRLRPLVPELEKGLR